MKSILSMLVIAGMLCFNFRAFSQSYDFIPSPEGYAFTLNKPTIIDDKAYLTYKDEDQATFLFIFDGTTLTKIDNPEGTFGIFRGYNQEIVSYNNTIYCQYINDLSFRNLYKLDGMEPVQVELPENCEYQGDPIVFNGKLYLKLKYFGEKEQMVEFDGSTFRTILSAEEYQYLGSPVIFRDTLYLAYANDNLNGVLMKFDGDTLTELPSPINFTAAGRGYQGQPVEFRNKLYLKYWSETNKFILMEFDGSEFNEIDTPEGFLGTQGYQGNGIVFQDNLYLRYQGDETINYNYQLVKFDGNSLSPIPSPEGYDINNIGYTGEAVVLDNRLFLGYIDDASNRELLEFVGDTFTTHPLPYDHSGNLFTLKGDIYMRDYSEFDADLFRYELPECSSTSEITVVSCSEYLSPGGKLWTESGVYKDTLLSSTGCDSIITITLSISQPQFKALVTKACDSLVSPSGQYTWKESGLYSDTIMSSQGCDSIIEVDLTIHHSAHILNSLTTCGPYLSPGGKWFSLSGTYTDTLLTKEGCPAYLTTELEINPSEISEEKEMFLTRGDTIYIGGQEVTEAGEYTELLYTQMGCDSLITYHVDFKEPLCSDTNLISVTDTLIIDLLITKITPYENLQIKVYPNPAKDHLFLSVSDMALSTGMHFEIFNSLNQIETSGNILQETTSIDMTPISSSGLYFLKLLNERNDVLSVKKIVVQ